MAWYAAGVLFVAYTFSFADRITLSLLVEPIKQDLALSDTKISRATRFRFRHAVLAGPKPELDKRIERGDIRVRLNTQVSGLIKADDGAVIGVVAEDWQGQTHRLMATAVILATGGYAASAALKEKFNPNIAKAKVICPPHATGDGIVMGEQASASLVNIDLFIAHPGAVDGASGRLLFPPDFRFFYVIDDAMVRRDGPLSTGPYYVIPITGSVLISHGGVAVNHSLQVMGSHGKPLKGLYAAGETLGSAQMMGNAVLRGMSVGPAITLGRLVARNAWQYAQLRASYSVHCTLQSTA
jgi:succinate dehydrogenase/fumarate reductase flavoprotein subunit